MGDGGGRDRSWRPQAGLLGAGAEERLRDHRRLARHGSRRHRQQDVRNRRRRSFPRTASSTRRRRTKATRRARNSMPRRCSICRAADPRRRASPRSRWASPKAVSRPITSTPGRGNRAASRGPRNWPARRSRPRPQQPRSKRRCGCIVARCAKRCACSNAGSHSPSTVRCRASATWPTRRSSRSTRCSGSTTTPADACSTPITNCSENSATCTPPPHIIR